MKKLLIILITVLTLLALTLAIIAGTILSSEKASEPAPETTAEAGTEPIVKETVPSLTEENYEDPSLPDPTISPIETTEAPKAPTEPPTEPTEEDFGVEFKKINRTVYATARVNVRTGPAVKYEQIGKLQKGSAVEQIGIGDNGWSKIWFQGQKSYVATEYLTTKKPADMIPPASNEPDPSEPMPDFYETAETVYSTASLNVRSGPSTHYKSIGYLKVGQEAFRVGYSDAGWSRIRYESGYGYVSSKYVSKEKPSVQNSENTENKEDPTYKEVNEVVCAEEEIVLRTGPSVNHRIVTSLKPGQCIRRTATGNNGWSEVRFDGSNLYCISQHLKVKETGSYDPVKPPVDVETPPETAVPTEPTVPDKPAIPDPNLEKRDEYMTAVQDIHLYAGPDSHYPTQGKVSKGSLVHRTGICDNGWSRILLGGKEVYVVSAYLAEEKQPESSKTPAEPEAPVETTAPAEPESADKLPDGYTKNEKTVYTLDTVNVRFGPGTEHKVLGKLKKGTSLQRIAIGDDGWTLVDYAKKQAYIKSSYLSDEVPVSEDGKQPSQNGGPAETYKKVDETVYSVDSLFVRSGPGTNFDALGSLNFGDSIHRTGIGDKGWSQVDWEGKTAYAFSKYLSPEKPEIPDFGETTTPGFPTPNSPFIYQYADDPDQIPYAVFEPVNPKSSEPLPLIISLHGSAEVGKGREFMEGQHLAKVFREWEYSGLEPFDACVVCPHLAKNVPITQWQSSEGQDALFKLIEYLLSEYQVDPSRIILEGHSMGAQGALKAAADPRAHFHKLVLGSGYSVDGVDYRTVKIPVKGYSGGTGDSGPRDDPESYHFMNVIFNYFGKENWFVGPYTHDDVAIQYFQKDDDGDHRSDIITWMLSE